MVANLLCRKRAPLPYGRRLQLRRDRRTARGELAGGQPPTGPCTSCRPRRPRRCLTAAGTQRPSSCRRRPARHCERPGRPGLSHLRTGRARASGSPLIAPSLFAPTGSRTRGCGPRAHTRGAPRLGVPQATRKRERPHSRLRGRAAPIRSGRSRRAARDSPGVCEQPKQCCRLSAQAPPRVGQQSPRGRQRLVCRRLISTVPAPRRRDPPGSEAARSHRSPRATPPRPRRTRASQQPAAGSPP